MASFAPKRPLEFDPMDSLAGCPPKRTILTLTEID